MNTHSIQSGGACAFIAVTPVQSSCELHGPHRCNLPALLRICVIGLSSAIGLVGCGQPPGVVFEPVSVPLRWPAPPETARIEYVGEMLTSDDLKPGRSFGQSITEALFGAGDAHSMLTPYALCTDGRGRLFVCDSNAQVVHVFDLETREYDQWRPKPSTELDQDGGSSFSQPVGIARDSRGRLLVSDSVAGTIFVFDDDGDYLGRIGDEYMLRPCGIAADPQGDRIFVADAQAHEIVVLSLDGTLLDRLGTRGTEPGQFNFPTNVSIGPDGRLYVSDSLNFRVQVFSHDLEPVAQIGSKGDLPGYFSNPKGLALDSDNHLYVVDAHFEAVQIFDSDGVLLLTFGEEGAGPGQFWLPSGIHIDESDRIWIADPYNRRVQVFQYRPEIVP